MGLPPPAGGSVVVLLAAAMSLSCVILAVLPASDPAGGRSSASPRVRAELGLGRPFLERFGDHLADVFLRADHLRARYWVGLALLHLVAPTC